MRGFRLPGGESIRDAAAARLAPLPTPRLILEAARVLEANGTEAETAIAEALRARVASDAARPAPGALSLLRRWLNAFDDVERERVETDTRRLLCDHAAGRL